ncbi:MAG: 6-phosphofructokinase, partial [Clostridia bacterium]|nr:6-phosphofructokinase [Clostridia bacterium]
MAQKFRKIGVLTSGGDAPGMSAAIRAVTRAANARGVQVMGIIGGYRGMIHDEMIELTNREVSGKIMLSGTFLYSDRCLEFKEEEGM